jgi:hypothetical protein
MSEGEKLLAFLGGLILHAFYGKVTMRLERGKVTHIETQTRRMWRYKDLPDEVRAAHE